MKLVILDSDTLSVGDIDFNGFKSLGEFSIYGYTREDETISRINSAEAVFCTRTPITAEVIAACPNLKYIGLFSTGFNSVDIKAASERNIVVTNAPEYSTNAVAQHVFSFILDHYCRMREYACSVRNGDWINSKLFSYFNIPTQELYGQTLGIIGFGSIGKKVAHIADAFGMKVVAHTRTVPLGCDFVEFISLDEVFKRADVITLHCPLNEQTRGLISYSRLLKMKKSAVLVNTARGGLVIEKDLAHALLNNVISKAYLDVLEDEPMSENNSLIKLNNCVITPHVAWAPYVTRQRLVDLVRNNFSAYLNNKTQNVVSKGCL